MHLLKIDLFNTSIRVILISFVILVTLLMVLNDYMVALIFNQSYFLKESLLFKITLVLLIIPIFFFTSTKDIKFTKEIDISKLLFILIPLCIVHIFIASFIIVLISEYLLDLPFTFLYLIKNKFSNNFVFLITIYSLMLLIARYHSLNIQRYKTNQTTLQVKTGKKTDIIAIRNIDWIAAETPYVAIWVDKTKYLQKTSLAKILLKINNPDFIYIHSKIIANINKITSIQPRTDGDYNIVLYNGVKLHSTQIPI